LGSTASLDIPNFGLQPNKKVGFRPLKSSTRPPLV
jgi:hypothetical protein